jgi:hypothetical protein
MRQATVYEFNRTDIRDCLIKDLAEVVPVLDQNEDQTCTLGITVSEDMIREACLAAIEIGSGSTATCVVDWVNLGCAITVRKL